MHLKNSVFNAGSNNNPIQASGKASLTFDASELNSCYNEWDSSLDSASRWNGNIMFIGGGGGAQQTFTFKNGTVVNGGGAADGTSYWDMDESTRTLSDISAGGTLNLGWNSFSSEQDFIEVNLESGTQYAGSGISFGDNQGTMSAFGSITVNQSGTDMAGGYTRVHLNGDINIRASTYRQNADETVVNTYSSNYNMLGNTELLTGANLNIGHAAARGGSANFNIYGSNNAVEVSALFFNSGSDVVSDDVGNEYISDATVNLVFDKNSSNNTFRAMGDVNSAFGALGTNNFVLDGTGNTFYANSLNLAISALNAGQTGNFKMLGQGNVLNVTRFISSDGGTQDSAMGGSVSALFKGSSAANKNKVYVRDAEMLIQGSVAAESSLSINYEFAGNTVLRGASDNSGVWFKLHEWDGKQYTSNSSFTISGSGNDLLFSGLEIGKANGGQGGGKAVFKVSGGGNRIVVSEENAAEHNGFKVESGGELLYEVQNSGTSSILDYTGKVTTFTGKLTVDLSAMTRATQDSSGLVGGWERFDLYAIYGTGIQGAISNWFTKDDQMTMDDPFGQGYTYLVLNEEYVSLIARDESDEYVFVIDNEFVDDVTGDSLTSLSLWYKSTVPEPATYAAIFGALALALAVYKRRK